MQEDAYRAYLRHRLRPNAVNSYMANIRHVERSLGLNVDLTNLSMDSVQALLRRLTDVGTPKARVSDCGSALRQYATFLSAPAASTPNRSLDGRQLEADPAPFASLPSVDALSVPQLMQLYARILAELRERKITRTANGPIGDYAEVLFQQAFGWTLSANSKAGYDAQDLAGTRYQIKARRLHDAGSSRQLSAIRRLPERSFDVLAAILFDSDVAVSRAVLIPYAVVVEHARRVEHTNSWRLMLSDRLCQHPQVVDVSKTIKGIVNA